MSILVDREGYSLSGVTGKSTGSAIDCRACRNYGYLVYSGAGASGIFNLEASHDLTAWMVDSTYTATTGVGWGSAQISKYYPYVRANLTTAYSGAAGSASPLIFYAPGIGGG